MKVSLLGALIFSLALFAVLMVLGIREKKRNTANVQKIPVRVNVNGIRGKSTATRLITAILKEAGYQAAGKTTGSAARLFFWDSEEEIPLVRKPHGVSISEQMSVIDRVARKGADALVCECMAVNPELQKVYTHQMLKPTMTVIVNVLEDHLEEMGPTTEEIAMAFAETIPYGGIAVVPDDERYLPLFQRKAEERGSKLYVIRDDIVPDGFIEKFNYELFPHNCAVALTAARAMGIPDDTAMRGMLKARPDPGALHVLKIRKNAVFVNAMAANEPESTLEIFERIQKMDLPWQDPIVVLNCRPDRVDRTRQFIQDCIPKIPNATLVIIGEGTREVQTAYEKGMFPNAHEFACFEGRNLEPIREYLEPVLPGRLLFCMGNIHGIGAEFIKYVTGEDEK